jgi:hypothetical protein
MTLVGRFDTQTVIVKDGEESMKQSPCCSS